MNERDDGPPDAVQADAWLLGHGVPERWAERARQMLLLPLLPEVSADPSVPAHRSTDGK